MVTPSAPAAPPFAFTRLHACHTRRFGQVPHELIGAPDQGEDVVAVGRTDGQDELNTSSNLGHGLGI
jgi:hypothetical protein